MSKELRFVSVGKLGKTRGLNGEISVTPSTDFPERFLDLDEIYLRTGGEWKLYKIASSKLIANRPVLCFEGIQTREEAARLTNCQLAVTEDQLVELPEGSFFVFDLIGCQVEDSETGEYVGDIVDVERYPANDVYVINTKAGKLLLPAVREYVKEVRTEEKRVVAFISGLQPEE